MDKRRRGKKRKLTMMMEDIICPSMATFASSAHSINAASVDTSVKTETNYTPLLNETTTKAVTLDQGNVIVYLCN